jgi:hypothetical protein
VQFTLKGKTVRTNSATRYTKGGCANLSDNKNVEVTGVVGDDGVVTALTIEVK